MTPLFVREYEQTCGACPEQYEGVLHDGRHFYFRYRYGVASLGVGRDNGSAICDPNEVRMAVSDGLQGIFDSPQQRDEVFAQLFARRTGGASC